MQLVTSAQMQAMDGRTIEQFGIPGRVLMESAGRGAVGVFLDHVYPGKNATVAVAAGSGNNGGDGFVMARYLADRGLDVTVYLLAPRSKYKGDAAANLSLLDALPVQVVQTSGNNSLSAHRTRMAHAGCWVDAILGTGLNTDVRGFYRQVIDMINASGRPVLAIDIPSGLNADTGQPCGVSIKASATATFAFPKIGHLLYPGADLCGHVEVIDIGIPRHIAAGQKPCYRLITADMAGNALGRRPADTHKGRNGHVLAIGGATGKTGAATMAATAAMRIGAGLVTLGIPARLLPVVAAQTTEIMTTPLADTAKGQLSSRAMTDIRAHMAGKQSIAVGPGLGTGTGARQVLGQLLAESRVPVVIDADGLNLVAGAPAMLEKAGAPVILTPHPGEMARLTGLRTDDIQRDRVAAARDLARNKKVWVVLKGAHTIVADPDDQIWINPSGNAGMASGGMGDVLTGLIAGLLAQGCPPGPAACAGVYLHGLAADDLAEARGRRGYLATEVRDAIPGACDRVLNGTVPPAIRYRPQ